MPLFRIGELKGVQYPHEKLRLISILQRTKTTIISYMSEIQNSGEVVVIERKLIEERTITIPVDTFHIVD